MSSWHPHAVLAGLVHSFGPMYTLAFMRSLGALACRHTPRVLGRDSAPCSTERQGTTYPKHLRELAVQGILWSIGGSQVT